MEKPSSTSLFQVYLRLRPPVSPLVQLTPQSLYPNLPRENFLTVEPPESQDGEPTHITIQPPSDSRKRAVERFAFTRVFREQAEQVDLFKGTGIVPLVEGVLEGKRDGLVATLGVTGSGKSHTILGSKTQRGLMQLSLDLLYRSIDPKVLHPSERPSLIGSLAATDPSEAQILPAQTFLDIVYGDGVSSRAQTPMMVRKSSRLNPLVPYEKGPKSQWSILGLSSGSPRISSPETIRVVQARGSLTLSAAGREKRFLKEKRSNISQDHLQTPSAPRRKYPQPPSNFARFPDIGDLAIPVESNAEYAILVSMFEVYNDRIFDLLTIPSNPKDLRRRPLLFKPTEASPDRKVVAGLRKIVCGSYAEALAVLETGLTERRVAGTGSNSVSSRSHGFFGIEVRRRPRGGMANSWHSANLSIVDLAGSERARNAKTAGATLAEAGKINESLMYLGQCLQMQSDNHDNTKPTLVPFRQCKLTELLFSNSFPSNNNNHHHHHTSGPRNPQKSVMIVTADPLGDFNATSQILRYSALAREVTVPRIPSVSSTILAGVPGSRSASGNSSSPNSSSNGAVDEGVVEMAFSELARLNEEVEVLSLRLAEEEARRREAEEGWVRAEARAEEIELEVRQEVWAEMEARIEEEKGLWRDRFAEEGARGEAHFDKKLEILTKGIQIHEDQDAGSEYTTALERENDALRAKMETLQRELQGRSPSKKAKTAVGRGPNSQVDLGEQGGEGVLGEANLKLNGLTPTGFKTVASPAPAQEENVEPQAPRTGRKMRKLTTRKWDLMDEDELEAYES